MIHLIEGSQTLIIHDNHLKICYSQPKFGRQPKQATFTIQSCGTSPTTTRNSLESPLMTVA